MIAQQIEFEVLPPSPRLRRDKPAHQFERDDAMRAIIEHAGRRFRDQARAFTLSFLLRHGYASGEVITDACKAAGINPAVAGADDRAFGPVYFSLSKEGKIVKSGYCERRKGHGSAGGIIWRLRAT